MFDWLRGHLGAQPARTAPLQRGFALSWVISDDARQTFLGDRHIQELREAGASLVRIDFRLGRYPSWDDTILGRYEGVVERLTGAGIGILGLAGHGIVPNPQQAQWTANNAEMDGGDGHNPFIDAYVAALRTLTARFHDRVGLWAIWNEPNVWTRQERQGGAVAYSGGPYIYPSNYAVLLASAYSNVKGQDGLRDVTLISGGVFGHNNGGVTSPENAGATYLRAVFDAGMRGRAKWQAIRDELGSYPLDAVGQHLYLDQGGEASADHIRAYLGWVRQVVESYEGAGTAKPTYVMEAAWSTALVPADIQAKNLTTLYDVCAHTPYVAAALWYELQDNQAARTYYGVIDPEWNRKPSFYAFQQAAAS